MHMNSAVFPKFNAYLLYMYHMIEVVIKTKEFKKHIFTVQENMHAYSIWIDILVKYCKTY